MHLDPGATAIVLVFLATQTGALVYFAGTVSVTLRGLVAWRETREAKCEACNRTVIQLATKEGISI